jgi:hypothetical protein
MIKKLFSAPIAVNLITMAQTHIIAGVKSGKDVRCVVVMAGYILYGPKSKTAYYTYLA